ncbi:MAG: hypothetical protein MUE67_11145 [Anaerolineales bacterium]|jgi:hypothetical protein|nr:hypothetical protein [Anaerolineales bacterium]
MLHLHSIRTARAAAVFDWFYRFAFVDPTSLGERKLAQVEGAALRKTVQVCGIEKRVGSRRQGGGWAN